MKNHHRHIPFLVLSIAVSATVVALYIYMFYATSASVRQANVARDIVKAEEAGQSQAKSLSELVVSTAVSRSRLTSFFVPADDVVVFITAIESIGPQSGSTVSLASVDDSSLLGTAAGTIRAVRAHVSAHGSWSSVMLALALAEHLPYAVSIDHVQLNASNGGKAGQTWNLSFDIQAATIVQSSKP
jgi:hypothetical protein